MLYFRYSECKNSFAINIRSFYIQKHFAWSNVLFFRDDLRDHLKTVSVQKQAAMQQEKEESDSSSSSSSSTSSSEESSSDSSSSSSDSGKVMYTVKLVKYRALKKCPPMSRWNQTYIESALKETHKKCPLWTFVIKPVYKGYWMETPKNGLDEPFQSNLYIKGTEGNL